MRSVALILFLGLVATPSLFALDTVPGINVYVSPSGNDANPGTKAKPFATVARAQEAVRLKLAAPGPDITVLLRGAAGANGPSPGASARGDSAEALRRAHAGARILLAEDNDINREVAVAILQHVSCVVDVAEDGEQAVSKATSNEYDLVLMDVQMPKMDGLEATQIIRRSLPSGKLPIIAMTANVFSDDKAKCHAAGMDGFIAKPVDPEDLYSLLSTWLERRRAW